MRMKLLKPAVAVIAAITLFGVGTDPVRAEQALAQDEVKTIAEEAFLYGFPMVVGYSALNNFFINPDSGQFRGPINLAESRRQAS